MTFLRRSFLAVVPTLAVLTSCGSAGPSAADRLFVAQMIPHHHLGMEMIDQATRHVEDTRLRRLVFEMGSYHAAELDQLHEWAKEWGVESADRFPGEIAKTELADLAVLVGREYDRRWLELMIEHHEGALEISARQMQEGSNDESIEMAESVLEMQQREIREMRVLLPAVD